MSNITVANTDWSIVSDTHDALAGAQIGGQNVFADVTVTTSRTQARECQFAGAAPKAIVRYVTTAERVSPEDVRGCYVAMELILVARVACGVDESQRMQEILRLCNAAKNAVETDAPAAAGPWGDNAYYHDAVRWGDTDIDTESTPPWAVARLPVTVGFALDGGSSH